MSQGAASSHLSRPLALPSAARAGRVVVATIAGLLLAGCTDDVPLTPPTVSSAAPVPDATVMPTETTSPVVLPARPPDMGRDDDVGAAAAATYFMRLFEYVMKTGDVREWEVVSAQGCDFCTSVAADVERVYSTGGRIDGGRMTLEPADVLGQDPTLGGYGVGIPFEIDEGAELDSEGVVVTEKAAESAYAVVDVIYSAAGWTIVGLSLREGTGA